MWTGSTALKNIDQSLQTIRNEVVRLDNLLTRLTESLAKNQRHRVKLINDIAAVRLTEIDTGELQSSLTAADQQALKLLEQRDEALAVLNEKIERLDRDILAAEQERETLLATVNQNSQNLVELETKVQGDLKKDQHYLDQLAKAQETESIAEEAQNKVELAQEDMNVKALPYKEDELFMYLWNRGFGTTDYSGGFFGRFMDGWVARVIKYEPARINFWNLTEIPKRLNNHAEMVDAAADEELMALQQLEVDALTNGGVKDLEQTLAASREILDKHDDELEEQEHALNKLLEERARFVAGDDECMQRCLSRLTQVLEHKDLNAVHQYVRQTNSPTDDNLVIELQTLDDRLDTVRDDLADVRTMHDKKISKLKELEQVRRNFKNSRYDDVRSGFGNEAMLATILGQFLQGVASGSDLWRVIQRNQRYRDVSSLPDFGSGGIFRGGARRGGLGDLLGGGSISRGRRKRRNSSWHLPTPRRGGGGFRFPGSGGGGGGFKTGGGF